MSKYLEMAISLYTDRSFESVLHHVLNIYFSLINSYETARSNSDIATIITEKTSDILKCVLKIS